MATKRKIYRFRKGEIIDVEEFHDGNFGAPGRRRQKKKKATKEEMQRINAWNKTRRCRRKLLEYFQPSDIFATWTYQPGKRPPDMAVAVKDFQKAIRKIRIEYAKRGSSLYWIRNIERGTKGAWHIHLVINRIPETESILQDAWKKGGTWVTEIKKSERYYDVDFSKLASYITKDENAKEENLDTKKCSKPRIKEANYSTSRNMPLKDPKVDKLQRWKKDPKPQKGYYIARIYEGLNPATGFMFRRYTMIQLEGRKKT